MLIPDHCLSALFVCSLAALSGCGGTSASPESGERVPLIEQMITGISEPLPYSEVFDERRITEASGLQRSHYIDGAYYVHNDSSDTAVVYVTDSVGQSFGTIALTGRSAIDWEAMAGVQINGVPHLIVGDIGDNERQRSNLQIHVLAEPVLDDLTMGFTLEVTARTFNLNYADGITYDAEALFVDSDNDTLVIVTKDTQDTTKQGIWTGSISNGLSTGTLAVQYRGLVDLPDDPLVNAITDIDIHPDNRELAVLTYGPLSTGKVYIWSAREGEGLVTALTRAHDRIVSLPFTGSNIQAEGVSYSADGEHLLISAEGTAGSTISVTAAFAQ